MCSIKMNLPNPPTLSQRQRMAVLLVTYSAVIVTATWLAYGLRFDFVVPLKHRFEIGQIWIWVWVIKLMALALTGQFSSLLSFFSLPDLQRLGLALGLVTTGLFVSWHLFAVVEGMPRGVILLDGIISFLGLSMCRLGLRVTREGMVDDSGGHLTKQVGIVGAGEIGAALARELQTKGMLKPVIFFDDSVRKKGTKIHGIPVSGPVEILRAPDAPELSEVIIAMPSTSGARVREVVELLDELEVYCRTVPSMSQIAMGEVIAQLRPVEIGDILGRETVYLDPEELCEFIRDKTVLVTGAGGSIGSELCRQLVNLGLARLILVDHSEYQLFEIQAELAEVEVELVSEVLDVQDVAAIKSALNRYQPSVIFHAAAYKHVSLMEHQPMMAIRNSSSQMCRNRRRRALLFFRVCISCSAGNSNFFGLARVNRCSMTGTLTRPSPNRIVGFSNDTVASSRFCGSKMGECFQDGLDRRYAMPALWRGISQTGRAA